MAKILYAEDEALISLGLTEELEKAGYQVDAVSDGAQLLKKLETGVYDIIVTDNKMPGVTGIEALKHIRADVQLEHVPVVVLTGDAIQREVEALGGFYVSKSEMFTLPHMISGLVK